MTFKSYRQLCMVTAVLLLGLLTSWPLSAQWTTAHPGMEWRAIGTGRTTGHVITLTISNLTPGVWQTEIGPFYIPGENGHQGYVINEAYPVEVPAFGTASIALEGYCTDIFDLPIAAGDAAPSPDSWVSLASAGPIPGPGWQATQGDGFEPRPTPQEEDIVLTYPGTAAAFPYQIDIGQHPESVASTLIAAVDALENAYDILTESGDIPALAYAPNPTAQRLAIVQQSFWYYTSLLQGGDYSAPVFQQQLTEQLEQWANQPAHTFTQETEDEVALTAENLWSTMSLVGQEAKLMTPTTAQTPMLPSLLDWLDRTIEGQVDSPEAAMEQWLILKDTLRRIEGLIETETFTALNEQLDQQLPGIVKEGIEAVSPETPEAWVEIRDWLLMLNQLPETAIDPVLRRQIEEMAREKMRQYLEYQSEQVDIRSEESLGELMDLLDELRLQEVTQLLPPKALERLQEKVEARIKDWLEYQLETVEGEAIWDIWDALKNDYVTASLTAAEIARAKQLLLEKWENWLTQQVDEIDPAQPSAGTRIDFLHSLLRTSYGEAVGSDLDDSLKTALEQKMQAHLDQRIRRIEPTEAGALEDIRKLFPLVSMGYGSEAQEREWFEQLIEKLNEHLRTRAELLQPDRPDFLREARALALIQEYGWFAEFATPETRVLLQNQVVQATAEWNSRQLTPLSTAALSWQSAGLTGGQWKILFPALPPTIDEAKGLSTAAWAAIIGIPVTGTATYLLLRDGEEEPPLLTLQNDALTIACPGEGSIDVLANDTGKGLQLTNISPTDAATVTNQGGGLLLITGLTGPSFSFTYTAADRAGQSAQATVNVTVTLPAFAPADDSFEGPPGESLSGNVLANDTGTEVAVSDFTQPQGGTLSLTPATGSFSFSPTEGFCGTTSFSYTVEDPCGQLGSAAVTLRIPDSAPPEISCPDNITISCEQEPEPEITGFPTATDDCDTELDFNYADEPGGTPCEQTVLRTWTARDDVGNEAACEQTITIVDEEAPEITCPEDIAVACSSSTAPSVTGTAEATDNCTADSAIDITFEDEGDELNILRTWQAADDCGNTVSCAQIIELIDEAAPEISCPPDLTISCEASTEPAETGFANATDNCDPEPAITFNDEISGDGCNQIITRTWTATDASGNVATCQQTIQRIDEVVPEIVCPTNVTVFCNQENDLEITGTPLAQDACSPNVTVNFTDDLSNFNNCEGFIVRTWTATDACGNTNSCQQTITVQLGQLAAPGDFYVTAGRASQPLPDLPVRNWGLPEHPAAQTTLQLEGMPVLGSWGYFLSEKLQLQYTLGKGTGQLQHTTASGDALQQIPLQYWLQEASVRLYHGQGRWVPYTGLGGQWYRWHTTDSASGMVPLPRQHWLPFFKGGMRLRLWRDSYLMLEGQGFDLQEQRWPSWQWQTEVGVRF
ncbi:MAG: hypothetical protein GVY26_09715 [Bacteroidetes bacterium]|jgi:hypothetical protein|nr:hypothetical protein [Bacteroidota bacterium]